MQAITANELIEKLQKIVADDKLNGDLPCYIFPEGGEDVLMEYEIEILDAEPDYMKRTEFPKRLLIG